MRKGQSNNLRKSMVEKATEDSRQGNFELSEKAKYVKNLIKSTRSMEGHDSSLQGGKMRRVHTKYRAVRRTARRSAKMKAQKRLRRGGCWRSDPVNWTATQLRPNCRVPKAFRRWNSTVKRIIYSNKTIEYTVCNKSTKKCKEQPYYSWRMKKMVERPPCCIAHILETFRHVTSILDRAKIPYFLTAGGLIGWVKGKSIPRYENDLDILVDLSYWSRFKDSMMSDVVKYGHFPKEKFSKFLRIYYSETNKVFVDAWPYKIVTRNGSKWVKTDSFLTWHDNPYSSVFPLQRSTYSGLPVWVPNDPENVLDRHYGKRFNWRRNVLCKTNCKKKCTS